MSQAAPPLPRNAIREFGERNHIAQLALFGSALRGELQPHSDLDFLVRFQSGHTLSLFRLAAMQEELTQILGRAADLRTAEDLSRYFRDRVVAEAKTIYER